MVFCGHSFNCTTRTHVNASDDIAGTGVRLHERSDTSDDLSMLTKSFEVLAAFLASALITIAAIAWGYLSDSLPEWYLNETDRTIISSIHKAFPTGRLRHKTRRAWFKIKTVVLRPFGRKPNDETRCLTRSEREEALCRFILALSDQQLATGLAILVAAVANQCTLSAWDFQVAFALAWFSSTTHLATLDVLQDYFLSHAVVRNWRVGGMVALMLLLSYALLMSKASSDETVPAACMFQYFDNKDPGGISPIGQYTIISAAVTLLFLLRHYVVAIMSSYRLQHGKPRRLEKVLFNLRTRRLRSEFRPSKAERQYILQEAVLERRSRAHRKELEGIRESRGIVRHWLTMNRTSRLYSQSFISSGPPLFFMLSYGFTQLYDSRWHDDAPVTVQAGLSFGQITPIFLLVLPMLAAGEIYYEVKDDERAEHASNPLEIPPDHSHPGPSTAIVSSAHTDEKHRNADTIRDDSKTADTTPTRLWDQDQDQDEHEHTHQDPPHLLHQHHHIRHYIYDECDPNAPPPNDPHSQLTPPSPANPLEPSLPPSPLFTLLELLLCSLSCIALGILLNASDPSPGSTIASLTLLSLYGAYELVRFVGRVRSAWEGVQWGTYARLVGEARGREGSRG